MRRASYDLKLDRAEQHLLDLEAKIGRYVNSHPYEIRIAGEGKNHTPTARLNFTSQPDEETALITGDVIYNLRAALDHITAALVNSKRRRKVYFPIFFQGVWDEPLERENKQRTKARSDWRFYTETMTDGAVEILKKLQPPEATRDTQALPVLNALAAADRHRKLPVTAGRLKAPLVITAIGPDGDRFPLRGDLAEGEGLQDQEQLPIVYPGAKMEVEGTPAVVVDAGLDDVAPEIPVALDYILSESRKVMDLLRPFDRIN